MRATMFGIGFVVIAWGIFLWRVLGYPIWITLILGIFNITLGVITPKSRKVDLQPEPSGTVKLVDDKVLTKSERLQKALTRRLHSCPYSWRSFSLPAYAVA